MAKKTVKKIECENIVSTDGLNVNVKPNCPHKVAVGNNFITTSARCIKCNERKAPTTPDTSAELPQNGDLTEKE